MEKHILLLHGALGSKHQFETLISQLHMYDAVHSFNFYGHGGNPVGKTLSMPMLVDQLKLYITQNIPANASLTIFGYSMGGYAALFYASQFPESIIRIITLGTKLAWSPEIAEREVKMLNDDTIEQKIPAFAKELESRHQPEDWREVLRITRELMIDLGQNHYLSNEVLAAIGVPVKLMIGDKDNMVSLEETVNAFKKIPNGTMSVLPSTPHPIERVNPSRLLFELSES